MLGDVGAYLGLRRVRVNFSQQLFNPDGSIANLETTDSQILSYGLNANLQLLSFIISKSHSKLDLYVSGKFGGGSLLLNIP